MKRVHTVVAACLVVAASATGRADEPAPGAPSADGTFRTGTQLVALNVTVTNRADRHVLGLTPDQFVVMEEGVRQPVAFFAAGSVPLDLAILIDASASMQGKIELAREAAAGLARSLGPDDRASLVEFRDAVRIRQPLTTDKAAVETAIRSIQPRGSTSLFDALYIALKQLTKAPRDPQQMRRQAIVVLSDGDDTASLIGYEYVSELARRSAVVVYTVSLKSSTDILLEKLDTRSRGMRNGDEYAMKSLAQDTGGRAFFPTKTEELQKIYDGIADELAHQYALGYVPTNARHDGGWRRVAVQVLAGDATPRTRTGYFALDAPRAPADGAAQR